MYELKDKSKIYLISKNTLAQNSFLLNLPIKKNLKKSEF